MLIAHLSDMHVAMPDGALVRFVDGRERLQAAITQIASMARQPDALVLTGDLVDHGTDEEYGLLREVLAPLTIPVFVIPGNHDDRAVLLRGLPDHDYLPRDGSPLAYTINDFDVRLIGLDTLRDGYHDGELDPARLEWLDTQLQLATDTPTFVIMHHPPFATGIWWMDGMSLRGADDFGAVIARHPQVQRVVAGHVHHYATGEVGGVACNTAPGVSYQAVLELDTDASPKISNRGGAILFYGLTDGACVAHAAPYGESGTAVLDFANVVPDYPAFAARLRSGEGLTKDAFGM